MRTRDVRNIALVSVLCFVFVRFAGEVRVHICPRSVLGDRALFIPKPSDITANNAKILEEVRVIYEGDLVIVAKGPSAKYVGHAIGINQAVLLTDRTILVMNDFIAVLGIEHILPEIKYVFMPYYPHGTDAEHYLKPNKNKDYRYVCNYMAQFGFVGQIYIYHLFKPEFGLPTLDIDNNMTTYYPKDITILQSLSTTDVPIQIFRQHLNVSSIHTYGFRRAKGYHPFVEAVIANMKHSYIHRDVSPLVQLYLQYVESQDRNHVAPYETGLQDEIILEVGLQDDMRLANTNKALTIPPNKTFKIYIH